MLFSSCLVAIVLSVEPETLLLVPEKSKHSGKQLCTVFAFKFGTQIQTQ